MPNRGLNLDGPVGLRKVNQRWVSDLHTCDHDRQRRNSRSLSEVRVIRSDIYASKCESQRVYPSLLYANNVIVIYSRPETWPAMDPPTHYITIMMSTMCLATASQQHIYTPRS